MRSSGRVEDLDLGAEGEHVEYRDIGESTRTQASTQSSRPATGVRAPADPDVRGPAEQGGEAPAAR